MTPDGSDELSADSVIAAVRVHADRVHDAVRRLGCGPEAAVQVVESSALELVDTTARQPELVGDPVGWWFARARALGRRAAGGDELLPLGGGVLSSDANQVRLAEALESLPERDRAALLLRDSYDLAAPVVGGVLGLDADAAMEVVGHARLAFLPALTQTRAARVGDHPAHLAPLARLAEGGRLAAREGGTRRHVQSCDTCAGILDGQERARRLLTGLTVVALPDEEREHLLAEVETRARSLLPTVDPDLEPEWDEEPHHRYLRSLMALGLVLAAGTGAGAGALASRGSGTSPLAEQSPLPLVTAGPVLTAGSLATPAPSVAPFPSPRVFLVTPSPTPTPTSSPTPSPTPTQTPATTSLQLDPTSGPAETVITVTGAGWNPGTQVTIRFLDRIGGQAGATAQVVTDAQGTFTATIAAHDDNGFIGPHTVTADDGSQHQSASFTIT